MFSSPHLQSAAQLLWRRIAIICIAASAHCAWAQAQNSTENTAVAQEQIERQRISKERKEASAVYEQQRRACYQQFAVTTCLEQARDSHNEQIRDLKRQEVSLNDAQRRRAGADRLQAIENRNSNEAQLAQAQRRGKALDAASKRQAQQEAKEQKRQNKAAAASSAQVNPAQANSAQANSAPSSPDVQKDTSKPTAPKRATRESKPATKTTPDAALLERNRAQSAEREKAAQIRREKIKEREAKRSKPAAAPLPMPAMPPTPAK